MKCLSLWIVLCIIIMIIGGCGFKDIDKRFFVLAIGIDYSGKEEKPYKIILKLGIPSPRIEPGKTNRFVLVTSTEATIAEGMRIMKSKVDKEIDFSHARIIVFGKEMAMKGIEDPLDWFLRRRDIQQIAYLAIGDPTAEKVLKKSPKTERLPGNSLILSFGKEGTESSFIATETLADFHKRLRERGLSPYLPIIKPNGEIYEIDQVAVLKKGKVKMVLNAEHTRLFNELVNRMSKFEMNVMEKGKLNFALAIMTFKMKYKLDISDPSSIVANIRVKTEGFLEESSHPLYHRNWTKLEKIAEREIAERYVGLLTKLQQEGLDPVGFGLRYRAMGYVKEDDWIRWKDQYPNMKIKVDANVKIYSTGLIK